MTPDQGKHLDYIQAVINRMAHNSFLIKGWTISIVSAILAITVKEKNGCYCFIGLFPVINFWLLDSYYLLLERRYRELYKNVVDSINTEKFNKSKNLEFVDLSLSVSNYLQCKKDYFKCLFSISESFVYLFCVLFIMLLIAFIHIK